MIFYIPWGNENDLQFESSDKSAEYYLLYAVVAHRKLFSNIDNFSGLGRYNQFYD